MKRVKRIACTLKPKTDDDEMNVFLERYTADAVDMTLPDISFLRRRRSAVHLSPGDAALLAGDTIASVDVNRSTEWEVAENVRSIYGYLEHDSKDFYYFTLHDAGWPNMLLRFRPEEAYRLIFERLTNEPMPLELIGELDEIVFNVKGFRPIPENAFEEFHSICL